ncbi:MAG: VWA domain-containing protein [Vicinamibacterales bacterium]
MNRLIAMAGLIALAAPQFTSSVNQIEIYASATDARGRPVEGLRAEDFDVREDGVSQRITVFAEGDFPLSAAIAVDSSFSMTGDRLAVAKSAARIFLGSLRPEDQSMVMSIGGRVDVIAPLSSDRDAQFRALDRLQSWGTTSLHDAVLDAVDRLQPSSGRRALIVLSDGDDRYSEASADEVVQRARRSDVMIYPVALGRRMPVLFTHLATVTGGRAFHERSTRRLPETLRAIAQELRRQYLIGYTPARPFVPGAAGWRDIDVRATRPGVTVRARDGYYAQ